MLALSALLVAAELFVNWINNDPEKLQAMWKYGSIC